MVNRYTIYHSFAGTSPEDQNIAPSANSDNFPSIEVATGLRFDVEPVDTIVLRGQDATFHCVVSETLSRRKPGQSPSIVNVTWRKIGESFSISGNGRRAGNPKRTVLPNGSLRIERVQTRAEVGSYECMATASYGVLVSRRASLEIAGNKAVT